MDTALLRSAFRNFGFNHKSNFKGHLNRMAISYAVLNKEHFSILNIIQIILILVSVFLSLKYKYCIIGRHIFLYIFILTSILIVLHLWSHSNFLLSMLFLSGDVEMNSGPWFISKENFLICHWNLNSITAHNYTKILLLKAYIADCKFDIICYLSNIVPQRNFAFNIRNVDKVR